MPPPHPGPTPGPRPEPTPPPEPEPMPAPEPVPFDGGPRTPLGSPIVARFGLATGMFGITTVGSTANLGSGLRMTAAGGVICSRDFLGSLPADASSLSRSPPPPPPPAFFADTGRV